MKYITIILLFYSVCYSAEVVRYLDPGASGAQDGTSEADAYIAMDQWNAAEATDLTASGNTHVLYCSSSDGSDDTNNVVISGWTTDEVNNITIIGSDFPSDGI